MDGSGTIAITDALPEMLLFVVFIGIVLWSTIWAHRQAQIRGKSGLLVALMVFLVPWPLGLLVWLVIREHV